MDTASGEKWPPRLFVWTYRLQGQNVLIGSTFSYG